MKNNGSVVVINLDDKRPMANLVGGVARRIICLQAILRRAFNAHSSGGVVEWSIAPVLKTGDLQGSVGSNPTPSANFNQG